MTAELFDLYDGEGAPLGTSKPRDQVHRDGDWHRSVALWIVRARGSLIVQRRSLAKDTHPGAFTASVSGHYAAGEQLEQVLREAREEIGVAVSAGDLVPVCVWRSDDRPGPGLIDRELMDIFLWPLERDLTEFSPDRGEVMGLAEIEVAGFQDLLNGSASTLQAQWLATGSSSIATIALTVRDFVPAVEYHRHVARAALAYLSGARPDSSKNLVQGRPVESITYGDSRADTP
jgi:isopentenyldiphosphate isomerase